MNSEEVRSKKYVTLAKEGMSEYTDRKSRFIGYAKHIENESEAAEFIASIRKKHSDARHNVYAYVTGGGNITGYSDDGEPGGTAGMPVLDVIRKGGFTDAVIVVTRYFGGILLGTGGLVKAYTTAARDAAINAKITAYVPFRIVSFCVDYSFYQKLSPMMKSYDAVQENADFGEKVTVTLSLPEKRADELVNAIFSASSGRYKGELKGTVLRAEQ